VVVKAKEVAVSYRHMVEEVMEKAVV